MSRRSIRELGWSRFCWGTSFSSVVHCRNRLLISWGYNHYMQSIKFGEAIHSSTGNDRWDYREENVRKGYVRRSAMFT